MSGKLSTEQGTALVRVARKAIEHHVSGKRLASDSLSDHSLGELKGVFVTLLDESGRLRGCIGNPFPEKPLINQTVESAIEAASMDPRFNPLGRDEVARVIVEVTVLLPIEPVEGNTAVEISSKVVLGKHGLIVDGFGSRGLLLPQVAVDEGFDAEEFLSQCCMKAGLLPDAWLTGNIRVSRFEGQVFSESTPGGSVFERTLHSVTK